jgi:hypothetical protein
VVSVTTRQLKRQNADDRKYFPTFLPPMMANSVKEPFDSPDWIFEVKLHGYRGIAVFDAAGMPHLWSRNGLPLEQKFPAVAKALSKVKLRSTILDGEVVAVDENGIPRFQLLQRFQKQPPAPTLYYVFDALWHDGVDLTGKATILLSTPANIAFRRANGTASHAENAFRAALIAIAKSARSASGTVASRLLVTACITDSLLLILIQSVYPNIFGLPSTRCCHRAPL